MENKPVQKRSYRYFYHYFKAKKKMSVHFRGSCHVVDDIVCLVPCQTKWKPTQPNLVMQGFAREVNIVNGIATIS